jgi:hypothetical protein
METRRRRSSATEMNLLGNARPLRVFPPRESLKADGAASRAGGCTQLQRYLSLDNIVFDVAQ